MGHVFDFHESRSYERWFNRASNRLAFEHEIRLMSDLLKPRSGESVLDIGCGIGECLTAFLNMGLQVTGLDPSTYMLDISFKKVGSRAELYRGFAEDLPFEDNSFNYACLFTTLEFADDYRQALREAARVAKDRLFVGVYNRYAIKGVERRVKGIFSPTFFNHARFFSVWELKQTIRSIMGDVPVTWRTVCHLPSPSGQYVPSLERSKILQRCPFGAFAGMAVTLIPRLRTRPLTIRYQPKRSSGTAAVET
jgi:SAM-dependent methyltransferase